MLTRQTVTDLKHDGILNCAAVSHLPVLQILFARLYTCDKAGYDSSLAVWINFVNTSGNSGWISSWNIVCLKKITDMKCYKYGGLKIVQFYYLLDLCIRKLTLQFINLYQNFDINCNSCGSTGLFPVSPKQTRESNSIYYHMMPIIFTFLFQSTLWLLFYLCDSRCFYLHVFTFQPFTF
jgi:hypothetical protein